MVKTGASGGLDADGLMRASGVTPFAGVPRAGIRVLFRSHAGKP